MFENLKNIFKKNKKKEMLKSNSKDTAKERLHLVLMQDRANVSADFLDLMRKEIIEVIKKYIDIDEKAMDVRLTTETNEEGVQGPPALYANIPIINIKDEARKLSKTNQEEKIIQKRPPKPEKEENKPNPAEEQNKIQSEKQPPKEEKTKLEAKENQEKENKDKPKEEIKENTNEKPQNSDNHITNETNEETQNVKNEEATKPQEENQKENDRKEEKKS